LGVGVGLDVAGDAGLGEAAITGGAEEIPNPKIPNPKKITNNKISNLKGRGGAASHGRVARATQTHGLEARATSFSFFQLPVSSSRKSTPTILLLHPSFPARIFHTMPPYRQLSR